MPAKAAGSQNLRAGQTAFTTHRHRILQVVRRRGRRDFKAH
jgi:hypothetical protein